MQTAKHGGICEDENDLTMIMTVASMMIMATMMTLNTTMAMTTTTTIIAIMTIMTIAMTKNSPEGLTK